MTTNSADQSQPGSAAQLQQQQQQHQQQQQAAYAAGLALQQQQHQQQAAAAAFAASAAAGTLTSQQMQYQQMQLASMAQMQQAQVHQYQQMHAQLQMQMHHQQQQQQQQQAMQAALAASSAAAAVAGRPPGSVPQQPALGQGHTPPQQQPSQSSTEDTFYRANVASQPVLHQIQPIHVAQALLRAVQILSQITFNHAVIDCPAHGFIMHFLHTSQTDPVPSDGYHWLDPEVPHPTQMDPVHHITVYERVLGAKPGEAFVSMTRRRYVLTANGQPVGLQFVHYLAPDSDAGRMRIDWATARVVTPARRTPLATMHSIQQQQQYQQQQQQVMAAAADVAAVRAQQSPALAVGAAGIKLANSARGSGPIGHATTVRRKPTASAAAATAAAAAAAAAASAAANAEPTPPAWPKAPAQEFATGTAPILAVPEIEETPGFTERDVARARFTRNHEWMEDILHPAASQAWPARAIVDAKDVGNEDAPVAAPAAAHGDASTVEANGDAAVVDANGDSNTSQMDVDGGDGSAPPTTGDSSGSSTRLADMRQKTARLRAEVEEATTTFTDAVIGNEVGAAAAADPYPAFPGETAAWSAAIAALDSTAAWTTYVESLHMSGTALAACGVKVGPQEALHRLPVKGARVVSALSSPLLANSLAVNQ